MKGFLVKGRTSLATRMIVLIGSAAAAVLIAVVCYNYTIAQQTAMEGLEEDARNITLAVADRINGVLRSVEKTPLNLAAILSSSSFGTEELVRLLKAMLGENNEVFGMAAAFEPYVLGEGIYYFAPYVHRTNDRTDLTFLGRDSYHYPLMDWYQIPKELEKACWSVPYFDEGGGGIMMSTFSVPLFRQDEAGRRLLGVVTADISLSWLSELVANIKVLETGYAFVLSQNGDFVTHPKPESIMRESIFSAAEQRSDVQLRRIGRLMVKGETGFQVTSELVEASRAFLFYTPVGSTGWSLGVVFPEAELLAPVKRLTNRLLIIGGIGLFLLLIIVVLLSGEIARPLADLTERIKIVGGGEFAARAPEKGPREIVHLARSFNELGRLLAEFIEKRDFIRDTFGRYVTAEVVKKIMESVDGLELGGERRNLTMLMSDLRGFTALTSKMEPGCLLLE